MQIIAGQATQGNDRECKTMQSLKMYKTRPNSFRVLDITSILPIKFSRSSWWSRSLQHDLEIIYYWWDLNMMTTLRYKDIAVIIIRKFNDWTFPTRRSVDRRGSKVNSFKSAVKNFIVVDITCRILLWKQSYFLSVIY